MGWESRHGSADEAMNRCNNVLWIQGANQKHENGDTRMEG